MAAPRYTTEVIQCPQTRGLWSLPSIRIFGFKLHGDRDTHHHFEVVTWPTRPFMHSYCAHTDCSRISANHNLDISDIIYYLAIANIKQWMRYSLRFASHWNVPVFTTGGMEETFRDKSSEYRLELQTKVREDFTITEKVHTGPPPSWKRAPTSAFTFKTFYVRPYVKQG